MKACPTTEYTDDTQQEGNSPGTSDATAPRQAHSETVPAGTEEEPQQEQTQTDITKLHRESIRRGIPTGKPHTGITHRVF